MAKTAVINVRVEPELKATAEELYRTFGISLTEAISLFLHKSVLEGGLPFDLKQPRFNTETESAMAEADAIGEGIKQAKAYSSAEEMFADFDKHED